VSRAPARTAIGAAALAVGVAGLTVLLGITAVFHGTVVGSLLGDAITVQVRSIDYAAVAIIVALGAGAVADVLYIDIRDRASELAALVTGGWDDYALLRLVVAHGAIVGLLGGLVGAGAGLAAVAGLGGHPLDVLPIAVGCALAGPLVAAIASLVPAVLLARQSVAALTAEEA
jgi:ABC-type antimicrobial peptide transport system permease subunit